MRRVLVTGASSGLGRELAAQLTDAGTTVIATARRRDRLDALAAAHPGVEPRVLDVTDAAAVDDFARTIGPLNAAVLNAGITQVGPFDEGSVERDLLLLDTNVGANLRLARGLKPSLSGGRLVLVGSMAGFVPLPGQAVYSGTKAFIQNWGLALRQEWRGDVSVGVFAPGGIRTEMTEIDALAHVDKHLASVAEVAGELLRFTRSTRALHVPGSANRLAARALRLLSPATRAALMRRAFKD